MDLDPDACYRAVCARDPRFDGRFFTGVITTGVYCRPVCPARTPRRANVRFFASAAAAQAAGFRPCLRCRPETAPDFGAWRGASGAVSRALALIEMGALDEADVDRLAERVGIGGRQLRRLFQRHLGASPVAVAQTRRVLLARQLIAETSLPMTEVAMAAGFSSLRRFNETFQTLYRRPPSDFRRVAGPDAAEGEITLLLRYRPPYDWEAMLAFLRARAIRGVESVENGVYRRTISLEGAQGTVSVAHVDGRALRVALRFPRLSLLPRIIARLRRVFDLAADPQAIAADLGGDARLGPLVATRPGLRLPGAWDGFEMIVRAILGQQISVAAAAGVAGKLAARYGAPLEHPEPGLTRVFPEPAALAAADPETFPMTRARARTLGAIAAAMAADPRLFAPGLPIEAALAPIRALPGVGEWTAQYVAMRFLRETDAFPASDLGLLRAMSLEGATPSPRALLARAEAWRPWRAYAAQHLWTARAGAETT